MGGWDEKKKRVIRHPQGNSLVRMWQWPLESTVLTLPPAQWELGLRPDLTE